MLKFFSCFKKLKHYCKIEVLEDFRGEFVKFSEDIMKVYFQF